MKKAILLYLATVLTAITFAQSPFQLEWKSSFPNDVEWRMINENRTLVFGGNLAEVAMMDAVTGKILWKLNVKEKYGKKKAEEIDWEKNAGVVIIKVKGEKKQPDKTFYHHQQTGNSMTEEEFKAVKPTYTWIWKGSVFVKELNTTFRLSYEKKKVVSSMGKGTTSTINVLAEGDVKWSTPIEARYVRTLCTNAIPRSAIDFGGDFLKLMYANGKIFVLYEGMSVLDAQSGKLLWSTELNNSDFDFGLFKSTQTLGRAGYPEVTNDAVYVSDLSKGQYNIKKFDIETGKLLWTSQSFDKDDVVPDLKVVGNVLLAQFGGQLEVQSYIPGVNGNPDVCKSELKFAGNAGVKAYETTGGKVIWETSKMKELNDKFNGAITNIIVKDNKAYFASDKNFYCVDPNTGKPHFTLPIKTMKIGDPSYIFLHKDLVVLSAEEGVAGINTTDGKLAYATNTDKNLSLFNEGEAWFMWVGKDKFDFRDFIRIDLNDGKILGKQKDTSYPYFTEDGEYVIKFDEEKVMRYKTR